MVLDGVLNMDEYYAGREVQQVAASDAVWAGFFKGCMEAPESSCPLKRYCNSADELQIKIEDLIETIKYDPMPLGPRFPQDLVNYSAVKTAIYFGLYNPLYRPLLAALFDGILNANVTAYLTNLGTVTGSFTEPPAFPSYSATGEALEAIQCGETAFRTDNAADLVPTLQDFKETSWITGDEQSTLVYMACAAWQMKAREIYSGRFEGLKTKNPILFVGSPLDPLTPLPSAKNLSSGFEDSSLLQHDGYGHCSTAQPSLCTARAVRAYFSDGTLPDPGTVCKPSVPIFRSSDEQFSDVIAPLNGTSKRAVEERNNDMELLEAIGHIGRAMLGNSCLI